MSSKAAEYDFVKPENWQLGSKTHFFLTDLDGTLAASASGRLYSNSARDTVFFSGTETFINKYKEDGYTVLIVSNQATYNEQTKEKIRYVVERLGVPALVATGKKSSYRKPSGLLWHIFMQTYKINMSTIEELHYTGDAIGSDDVNPAYRWASSDKEFAATISATFHRPIDIIPQWSYEPLIVAAVPKTIYLLIGTPGSMKSTTAALLQAKLPTGSSIHLEQDYIGDRPRMFKAVKKTLENPDVDYVFVDATHGSLARRQEIYKLAQTFCWKVHILWSIRDGRPFNALRMQPVPAIAYNVYIGRFDNPINDGYPVEIIS